MGVVQHPRRGVLRAGLEESDPTPRRARDLQYRPRLAIHLAGVYQRVAGPRGENLDGRTRRVALDNVFVERLWRSLKNEELYLKPYANVLETERNLAAYFRFYNERRPHSTHDGQTPSEVHQPTKPNPSR